MKIPPTAWAAAMVCGSLYWKLAAKRNSFWKAYMHVHLYNVHLVIQSCTIWYTDATHDSQMHYLIQRFFVVQRFVVVQICYTHACDQQWHLLNQPHLHRFKIPMIRQPPGIVTTPLLPTSWPVAGDPKSSRVQNCPSCPRWRTSARINPRAASWTEEPFSIYGSSLSSLPQFYLWQLDKACIFWDPFATV